MATRAPSTRAGKPKPPTTYHHGNLRQVLIDATLALIEEGAIIYVCGDGGKMEPDVKRALMSIYREKTGADEAAARDRNVGF